MADLITVSMSGVANFILRNSSHADLRCMYCLYLLNPSMNPVLIRNGVMLFKHYNFFLFGSDRYLMRCACALSRI